MFFAPVGKRTIFFKKILAPPPPNIKWAVPNDSQRDFFIQINSEIRQKNTESNNI